MSSHRPAIATALIALLASLARDLEPYVAQLPVISEQTAALAVTLAVTLAAAALGVAVEYVGAGAPWSAASVRRLTEDLDADLHDHAADG